MDIILEKLSEIFEVEEINPNLKFTDMEVWDSLTSLSILAMLDSDYNMALSNADLLKYESIQAFCEYVIKNRK